MAKFSRLEKEQVIQGIIDDGLYPGPTVINRRLGRRRNKMNSINGTEIRIRDTILLKNGWKFNYNNQRWEPPAFPDARAKILGGI